MARSIFRGLIFGDPAVVRCVVRASRALGVCRCGIPWRWWLSAVLDVDLCGAAVCFAAESVTIRGLCGEKMDFSSPARRIAAATRVSALAVHVLRCCAIFFDWLLRARWVAVLYV
jgi:hypothetical protein